MLAQAKSKISFRVSATIVEIGLRLAIGATEWDVQLQFLAKAIVLSVIGGVVGLLLGFGSSYAVEVSLNFLPSSPPQYF
jgi:ABC-type antimicrobial peptide transport system permease subunit